MSKIEQIKIPVGLEVGKKVGKKACPHKWVPKEMKNDRYTYECELCGKKREWEKEDGIWCLVEEEEEWI